MVSLRGTGVEVYASDQLGARGRLLRNTLNATATQQKGSDGGNNNLYGLMMFLTVVVVIVVIGHMLCLWKVARRWFCGRSSTDELTPQGVTDENTPDRLVMSGRVFHLTKGQRRAVLEAIFSEQSEEVDVKQAQTLKKADSTCQKAKRDESSDVPRGHMHLGIRSNPVAESPTTKEDDHDHVGVLAVAPLPYSDAHDRSAIQETLPVCASKSPDSRMIQKSQRHPTINRDQLPPSDSLQEGGTQVISNCNAVVAISKTSHDKIADPDAGSIDLLPNNLLSSKLPSKGCKGGSESICGRSPAHMIDPDLPGLPSAPHFGEVSPEEDSNINNDKAFSEVVEAGFSSSDLLSRPSPIESQGTACKSVCEEEADDNVCPICLNIPIEGDSLVASKHCSHLFHKDCILEWLEKNDTCPVCRLDMITEREINKAASSIIGRTRMCVAVESISHYTRPVISNAAAERRHVLPAHRRIATSPQTPPPSPPHRPSRLMCLTVNVPQMAAGQGDPRAACPKISFL